MLLQTVVKMLLQKVLQTVVTVVVLQYHVTMIITEPVDLCTQFLRVDCLCSHKVKKPPFGVHLVL